MRRTIFSMVSWVLLCSAIHAFASAGDRVKEIDKGVLSQKISGLHIPFIQNQGQLNDKSVMFYANTFSGTVSITKNGEIHYNLIKTEPETNHEIKAGRVNYEGLKNKTIKAVSIEESLDSPNDLEIKGINKSGTKVNYFTGGKDDWRTNVPSWHEVSYGEVYQNIELGLKAYGRNVEKIFTVHPKGNVDDIKLKIKGATGLNINKEGELEIETGPETIKMTRPVAYHEINGEKIEIAADYIILDDASSGFVYGFRVGEYDKTKDIVIDPLLASTCVGGMQSDEAMAIASDSSGNVFVTGYTYSNSYPTTAGAYDRVCNNGGTCSVSVYDAFVSKLNPGLTSLIASTYIGRDNIELANDLALDSSGNVFITGLTSSSDYPVTPGAYTTSHYGPEVFVTKLSSDLSTLMASSFFGGVDSDVAYAIALDPSGNVFVTGDTMSVDFPTTSGAYDRYLAGMDDLFVTKLSNDLSSLIASSLFGGSYSDVAKAIALDSSGNVFIAGFTNSNDLPVPMDSYDSTNFDSSVDVLVLKFNNDLTSLYAWTFLEGIGNDEAEAIALDSTGNIYIAGWTVSPDFPTTPGAYDRNFDAYPNSYYTPDAFVSRLSSDLRSLLSSTFLGGKDGDAFYDLAIDSQHNLFMAGHSGSTYTSPITPGAYDPTCDFPADVLISNLSVGLIYVGPNPVNFGGINAGSTQDQTVTVRNDGASDLIIGNIAQADPVDTFFSITTDNCSGQTIAP